MTAREDATSAPAPTSVYRAALLAIEDAKRLDMTNSEAARHVTDAVVAALEDSHAD